LQGAVTYWTKGMARYNTGFYNRARYYDRRQELEEYKKSIIYNAVTGKIECGQECRL